MPLSKLLERGARITVVTATYDIESGSGIKFSQHVFRARVTGTARGVITYTNAEGGAVGIAVRRRDEGKTWARGWDGPDADALRATYLLQRSAS